MVYILGPFASGFVAQSGSLKVCIIKWNPGRLQPTLGSTHPLAPPTPWLRPPLGSSHPLAPPTPWLHLPPGTLYQAPPFVMPSVKLVSSSVLRQGARWGSDMTGLYIE